MVKKPIATFYSTTLVLSILQWDGTLMWTQLNTANKTGGNILENRKSCFSQIYPQLNIGM